MKNVLPAYPVESTNMVRRDSSYFRKEAYLFMSMDARKNEGQPDSGYQDVIAIARSLEDSFQELCRLFLPMVSKDLKWRYSREPTSSDPDQGWKLHLSATVLSAVEVLRKIAPFLRKHGVLFKSASSLEELSRINSGLYYGYGQVGKFITVYPMSEQQAGFLAHRLHEATKGMPAPAVPFDLKYQEGGCVYYRYGAFDSMDMESPDGTRIPAIRNSEGDLVPDLREAGAAKPSWVSDPFLCKRFQPEVGEIDSPLKTTFRAFRALAQRGKGGVYQAIDFSVDPPRLCILKEGRSGGEIGWDGRDGYWRVKNEEQVLRCLQAAGIDVPRIYSSFEVEDNCYLVTEFVEGESLQKVLGKRQRRLTVSQVIRYGIQLSLTVSQIHEAGWVWRDCKPGNLIVTKRWDLRPLDFEGACPIDRPDPLPWSTPDFAPPEWLDEYPPQSRAPEDSYAIGAVIYFLLTAKLLSAQRPIPISKLRRNVPTLICDIISDLLALDPRRRPNPRTAAQRFIAALSSVKDHGKTKIVDKVSSMP